MIHHYLFMALASVFACVLAGLPSCSDSPASPHPGLARRIRIWLAGSCSAPSCSRSVVLHCLTARGFATVRSSLHHCAVWLARMCWLPPSLRRSPCPITISFGSPLGSSANLAATRSSLAGSGNAGAAHWLAPQAIAIAAGCCLSRPGFYEAGIATWFGSTRGQIHRH
jgi:hypothetical protein